MRFQALDGWRGLSALAVMFFHFPILGAVKSFPLFSNAYLFVDFFFVLSGFVIGHSAAGRLETPGQRGAFLLKRFGRLWPLHAAVLLAFVAVALIKGDFNSDERHSGVAVLSNLAMIHGLGIHSDLTWNGPSWSISVEWLLYLIFALLSMARWRWAAYVGLVILGASMLAFQAPNGMASTFDFGVFRGLAGFFFGVLLTRTTPRAFGSALELATVAGVALFVSLGAFTLAAPLVFGFAVYVFSGSQGLVSRGLRSPPLANLGAWSYSIYMLHALFVAMIWALAGPLGLVRDGPYLAAPNGLGDLIALPYVVAVVVAAAFTYKHLELPVMLLFRNAADTHRKAVVAAPD